MYFEPIFMYLLLASASGSSRKLQNKHSIKQSRFSLSVPVYALIFKTAQRILMWFKIIRDESL